MRKYIDAEELKVFMWTMLTGNDLYTPNGIDEFVDKLPAADVVERVYRGRRPSDDLVKVVRCKDCKHYKTMFCKMDIWHKDITLYRADENDFCSYGEKSQ